MAQHQHATDVPRAAIYGAAALMVFTLVVSATARRAKLAAEAPPEAAAIERLDIRFEDRDGGSLAVIDASSGRVVEEIAPGTGGFVRGVLRGMFRARKLEAMDRAGVFRLSRGASGRLSLDDLASGRHVDLDSFGPTNTAAFAHFLGDYHERVSTSP
jgi:putative photosynthetic complex assembly protein